MIKTLEYTISVLMQEIEVFENEYVDPEWSIMMHFHGENWSSDA